MVKLIIVQWVPEETFGYGKVMMVIQSNHEIFVPGSLFDFGFFNIATDDGYKIISLPQEDKCKNKED
jgi:hypothetical protein